MGLFGPKWWHHHGAKIQVETLDRSAKTLSLQGSAAKLLIVLRNPSIGNRTWLVYWEIVHSPATKVNGSVVFTDDDLKGAFGLSNVKIQDHSTWMISRWGLEACHQGKYLRDGNYLNIPCPGTGHDGDPNISIELDDEIRSAITQLINF